MLRPAFQARRGKAPSLARRRVGAVQATELLLVVPILLAIVFALVEYAMILSVGQQLAVASREGARVAAQGGTAQEVETAARNVLGSGTVNQHAVVDSQLTSVSGDPVTVTVHVENASIVVPNL